MEESLSISPTAAVSRRIWVLIEEASLSVVIKSSSWSSVSDKSSSHTPLDSPVEESKVDNDSSKGQSRDGVTRFNIYIMKRVRKKE